MPRIKQGWPCLRAMRGFRLLAEIVTHLDRCDMVSYAKSIAWSAMFAVVPFLTLAALIAAVATPDLSVHGHASQAAADISNVLQGALPRSIANMLVQQLSWLQKASPMQFLSLSAIASLWTVSSAFTATMNAINRVYGMADTRGFWRRRFVAVNLMLVQVVLALVSIVAIVAWPLILRDLGLHGSNATVATVVDWVVVCLVTLFSFGLTFRFAPTPSARGRSWMPGSLFGAGMFLLTTYCFRLYVQLFAHYQTIDGPVFSGVLIMMIWIWLMSFVLLLAAELNRFWSDKTSRPKPQAPVPPGEGGGQS